MPQIHPPLSLFPRVTVGQRDVLKNSKGQMRQMAISICCYLGELHPHRPDILGSQWMGQFSGYLPRFWSQMAQVLILPWPLTYYVT